jgi:hypothetical protein
MEDLSDQKVLKSERFYEHDGAYYRHRAGGNYMDIDDVLSAASGEWIPYKGEYPLRPVLHGNVRDARDVPAAADCRVAKITV